MDEQRLIHFRDQVTHKIRHIIGNLVEANHDPSNVRSSLLRAFEKKSDMYCQEYAKIHQEILDCISSSELGDQEDRATGC